MFKLGPYEIAVRTLFFIAGVVVLILAVGFTVRSCDKRHNQAGQARVEHAQSEEQSNSAADAIGTVARSGEAERASEDLTRSNEQQIRGAEGANDKVNPAVRDAGIAALCRRQAYANDPRCKPRP
jgi:ABC-type protease/lipase transport system fused ATPase/permease subunit